MAEKTADLICRTQNGVEYWYVRIDGEKRYCGKGSAGKKPAEAVRDRDEKLRVSHEDSRVAIEVKTAGLPFLARIS